MINSLAAAAHAMINKNADSRAGAAQQTARTTAPWLSVEFRFGIGLIRFRPGRLLRFANLPLAGAARGQKALPP
jgi:hypothetical protein